MKDSHGRTIDYLRISLTDRCNFRCIYCMPEDGVQSLAHEDILRIEEIEQAVRVAAGMGIRSIRLTGGEPLVRLGVVDLVRAIAHTPGIEINQEAKRMEKQGYFRMDGCRLAVLDREGLELLL